MELPLDLRHLNNIKVIVTLNAELLRMNKKQFLLCKKLFGRINHHQLLNEYVLHNFFAFYQTLLSRAIKNNTTKWKEHFLSVEFALCH